MRNQKGYTLLELLVVLAIIGVIALIPVIAIWTDRTLDFWLTYCKGHTVNAPYWLSLVLTVILNGAVVLLNVISEIIRLAIQGGRP